MSAVSGLNAKAEKGRSKYVALDINSIYKGKSLENPKATIQPKHGLQSLGKVGTGRRMPPPANLPSLKSENSGNNPNISLVPSGGQGWGSTTKDKGKTEETNGNQQQSPQSQPASSLSQATPKTSTTNTVSTSGANKTWSSVTSNQEGGGQEQIFLGQQSPFFPQEFPKLAGGDVPTEGNQKSSADSQYGPGPSLRPQTEGSWGRGTLQQQPSAGSAGNQQQSSGSGVNGPQATSDTQTTSSQQHLRDQRQYSTSRGGPVTSSSIGSVPSGSTPTGPPMGPVPPLGHGPGMGGQMGPGSALHPPPQFRGMMPSFMFGRNSYPSGYPSNYSNVPSPPNQNARAPYPYSENRRPQGVRPLAEEEAYQRPAAIITEKALKGFDEILQNDTQDTWATTHGEIDYNAKLVFSDDEESPVNQKKEKRDADEKLSKSHLNKNEKERDKKLDRERNVSERERDNRSRETDWSRDGRTDKKESENDWSVERGESYERDRDERWKSWTQPPQGRGPTMSGMEMQRQWQPSQQPPQRPFDYRGPPPPQPPGSAYASPHARMAPGPVPLMQHGSYPPPRPARPGPRPSSVADDDEMWRQRRKQHTEEMTMTVERARQRRAEEEKHYEQSKQCAQEKAKTFEKNDKEKESIVLDDAERSRHSSESRDDKPPSRDGRDRDRDRDRSQPNYQGYNFSKQFQKNVPPRFQKQAAAEYMRQQQTQQQVPMVSSHSNQVHFMRSQSLGQSIGQTSGPMPISALSPNSHNNTSSSMQMPINYETGWGSPYVSQVSGMPSSGPKGISRQRSNSQGSATDSYESDGCAPEQNSTYDRELDGYWGRDRRPSVQGYDSWQSPASSENYYDQKLESNKSYDERHDFKRNNMEKDEKPFEAHPRESDRREKEFENNSDYRYKSRDSFKNSPKQHESREKEKKTNSWSRDYEERVPDPFDDLHESSREKSLAKDRFEKERWDKDRPQRPDSRDSRTSRDSTKDERHSEKHESSHSDRERKISSREEKKEKAMTIDWGDSPYPVETKRREWHHHHPPPITPKQFESIGPTKKNLTPLRRSNVAVSSQGSSERKTDAPKDENMKKTEVDSNLKKDKEAKEEKNENDRHVDKFEQSVDESSASTTESAQPEKYQNSEIIPDVDKGFTDQANSLKDSNVKNEKYKKDKKDNVKLESKAYEDRTKDEKGGFAPRGEPSRKGRGGGGTLSFRNSRGGARHGQNNYNPKFPKKEKKESTKVETKVSDDRIKDEKDGFAPRGEPSRRGRGGGGSGTLSFRNSRAGSRHGQSNYGPPPSGAGFGGNKPEKLEEQKVTVENCNELNQNDYKSNVSTTENINSFPRDINKSRSLERPQQRRPGRYDNLPPRFQKRQERRYDKFEQPYRGRGRGRSGYQGPGNQGGGKLPQGGKENLSDVANEEWETASESSDVADRRDKRDEKSEPKKKELREKGSSASRKSFSSQRPINEGAPGRRSNESRRGGGPNTGGDRNRPRDSFRDTRPRESGRGRQGNPYGNGDRRIMTNNDNSSHPNSVGQSSNVSGRSSNRNTNPSSKTGAFQPKSESTAAVYRVDEIKLQDPNGVQAALSDLTNRRSIKTEVTVAKAPKGEKDKTGVLEGYDLNNYASVVIIDDHPEVGDETNLICGTDDGFQEVTSKKRHKLMVENEVKKLKKEPHTRNKSGSRSRQSRLPPRFAKQRESLVKSVVTTNNNAWDISVDLSSKQPPATTSKDVSPVAPPSVNAWDKPISHSLSSHSPVPVSVVPASSCASTVVTTCATVVSSEVQVLASTSKSSSFDRSDQHDSGIDVSDQPASAASSQRSSPSNDCKILAPSSSGKNGSTEIADLDITAPSLENLAPVGTKSKETTPETDEKSSCVPVSFTTKENFSKTEESTNMKLEFNFDSGLEQLEDKTRNANNSTHCPSKSINIGRSIDVSSSGSQVGVQSPISPSADDLNLKIQSVKKVWENDPPLPTVMEHPQAVSDESPCPTSYGSFSSSSDPAAVYSTSVDSNAQSRKETESTELSYRENSPLQQTCSSSNLSKSVDHNVSYVKSHIQIAPQPNTMTGAHCTGPISPPLMSGLETMTGIRTIAGLASSVQVAGIPAIPSPPTVLFNSSQQMAQTGMYQPLQMDSRQTPAAAVAAAMVQFSQSPHGYPPLGTYGLSHQPPPNPQLSNAYGQQSLFVQPPAAHQGQDMYPSNQYRVQPPYPQNQHVSSNQVLSAQQNLAGSHLLGSQLVQTRPTAGPSPAAPHFQGLSGLQAVQPAPQTSYFSTSAQPQTANYYHQPPTTPGSPMQQQPQYASHQSYGSQSALNVLPQTAAVAPNFRNFGSHQFKAPSSVMNSIVPEAASLRSATRSPTIDVSSNRSVFGVSTAVSSTLSSTPVVAVPPMSSSTVVGKIGQPQANNLSASRISSTSAKSSQYSMSQSQQHYYPFGQQKFNHVQSSTVRPQVLFPNVVRNPPHQQLPAVAAAASSLHYPPPIQRPGPATGTVAQTGPQPAPKVGIRPQTNVLVPGGKLTSAQQAKLRAEAVQQTHMFFAQSKTGKHDENVSNMLSQEKNTMQAGSVQKLNVPSSSPDEENDKQCLSPANDSPTACESKESNENGNLPAGEE